MTNIQAINLLKGLEQSLDDYCELNDEGKTAFRMAIAALELFGNDEQLPSAQPEYRLDEWCTDCKEYDTEKHCCPRFNQVIRTTLNEMKSERKKGKWIYNSPVTMKCDQCGFVIKDWDWHRFKFCPNCDCDMRGEQE